MAKRDQTPAGNKYAMKTLKDKRASLAGEIESLKKLRHPNIVQLLGYGEQDGQVFYAMELVRGRSLQQELFLRKSFTWQQVVHYGIQMCAALKIAHDSGIIHRDIKPANLLLAEN